VSWLARQHRFRRALVFHRLISDMIFALSIRGNTAALRQSRAFLELAPLQFCRIDLRGEPPAQLTPDRLARSGITGYSNTLNQRSDSAARYKHALQRLFLVLILREVPRLCIVIILSTRATRTTPSRAPAEREVLEVQQKLIARVLDETGTVFRQYRRRCASPAATCLPESPRRNRESQ
jgi:hypothetical protein